MKSLWILGGRHRQSRQKTIDKLTQMSRITQKSHRPRASHRMMVGTLSQRLACAASPRMVSGPLHETTQGRPATAIHICRTVSALGVKPKILSTKKKGLDASNDRGLTERSGEVFSLDILSHRMVGIELRRAGCRWRVTNPALSIASWVLISTMATFSKAPL